ncbi:MAG: kinase, partial [Acidobacteriota bacterium]
MTLTAKLVERLSDPTFYPYPTSSVQVLQTHISWLFLTDEFVYKLKKPVDFGFLDYTTLERRRAMCEREVQLNSRLCPGVYLGVEEVHQRGEELS